VRSSLTIDVAAPPELVFRLAHRVERWPKLLPHYIAVDILERTEDATVARMVARRPLVPVLGIGLPVAWRARAWAEPADRRLRFHHLGGATSGMDVTWRIESDGAGRARVTLEHDFAPRIAAWASIVDRLFVRPIAWRTMTTFKTIAEAIASDASGPPSTTNPST
jgi:ribosome-associated toxin RatA of RatAB toxin-antitoxin module